MARIQLTDAIVKRLPAIAADEGMTPPAYFWDIRTPGLAGRVNRDGSVSWVLKLRVGEEVYWETFGSTGNVPPMHLKEAREKAESMRVRIRAGEESPRMKLVPATWKAVMDRFEADHLDGLKPKTKASYRSVIKLHLRPAFAGKMAHEITDADVKAFYQEMGETGKLRQANVALMLLRVVFERCEAWRHRPLRSNPVDLFKKAVARRDLYHESQRDRRLSDDELRRLGEALETMRGDGFMQFTDIVKLLLFTGARLSEVLGLRWSMIDEDRKEIHWPDTKTGASSRVLNDAAFEVLAGIPRQEDEDWVFPSDTSKSGHVVDIKRPWAHLLTLAKIENLTRHDLRHNLGNVAADEGESLQTVAALLGHREVSTTARYSRTKGADASNRVASKIKGKIGGRG